MAGPVDPANYKEALIVLGAAAVVVPVFHRLKVSPIVGFILVGMLVGPFGLGAFAGEAPWLAAVTISDPEAIAPTAELGVALLLFMIGLELSFERLKMMRKFVFGLGTLQLVLSAALIGAAAMALGQPYSAALVLGLALAMSSTAIVVQVLASQKRMMSPVGRTSFSILLLQDLAFVPVLFLVALLTHRGEGGSAFQALGLALGQAVIVLIALVVAGRLLLRPLFRRVARTDSPELFLAACLLVILAAALATAMAGVGMALGALLAGLLLAETEYRRQIEVLIEPFKGLLLGVFLISVGMGIDLMKIAANPAPIVAGCVLLVVGKAAIVTALARAFGQSTQVGLKAGLLLGAGGEFAFVILGAATLSGVVAREAADYALILAAVTMATIPLLGHLGERLGARMPTKPEPVDPALLMPEGGLAHDKPRVVIAGYGRVGAVVADMLRAHDAPYVVLDKDPDVVAAARKAGLSAYLADMSQPPMLRAVVKDARALVATMDSPAVVEAVVTAARAERADLMIVARARDARHASRLYQLGATDAVPETVEASLQLSEAVLLDIGIPAGPVIASIHDKRDAFRREIRGAMEQSPRADVFKGRRRAAREESAKAGSERLED